MIGTPLTQDTLPAARGGHVEVPTRRPARAAGSPDASYTYRLTQAVQRYSRQLRAQPYRHGSGNQHRRAASLDAMVFTLTRSPSPIGGKPIDPRPQGTIPSSWEGVRHEVKMPHTMRRVSAS